MKQVEKKYQCIPFWSWDDELDPEGLVRQVEWMNESGVGGFFMHARGGLKTEYLGEKWFECIDRGGTFREFVPYGFSKATGIQFVLDYYGLNMDNAYAFGDSNNDLTMLSYTKNSIAMGNANPPSLKELVSYVTTNASNNGIQNALTHYHFLD